MTRVDFYLLADVDLVARDRFACRLAQRAAGAGQGVHVHLSSEKALTHFDELLWNYPAERFVPHEVLAGDQAARPRSPISLGASLPTDCDGVLINLGEAVPDFFARFDRVAEIVVEENKTAGRDRYKLYRDRGYPLHHHDIEDWEA
ncbi:MAG: DNA polymerase III subunit chi [Pseudomonadota bacterium]